MSQSAVSVEIRRFGFIHMSHTHPTGSVCCSCAVAFALISSKETLIGETIFHHTVRNRRAKLEAKGALQKSIIRPGGIRTS